MINDIKEHDDIIRATEYIWRFTDLITTGFNFELAKLPQNDKTAILLSGLKTHRLVSEHTKLEHFRVLFGIPLHKKDAPFNPIKWIGNKLLLRYFIYSIFPHQTIRNNKHAIVSLFADKHGEQIMLPKSDKKRLEQSCDYIALVELIKKFNE